MRTMEDRLVVWAVGLCLIVTLVLSVALSVNNGTAANMPYPIEEGWDDGLAPR